MLRFISESGPYIFPLMLITVVIIVLTIRRGITVFSVTTDGAPEAARGNHAILFWGGFSALLGLLGQFTGMYKSLSVIVNAEVINPVFVMMGLKQTLNTTLYGFGQCLIAGIIWFILNSHAAKQRAA